jgi:hypothetical protein
MSAERLLAKLGVSRLGGEGAGNDVLAQHTLGREWGILIRIMCISGMQKWGMVCKHGVLVCGLLDAGEEVVVDWGRILLIWDSLQLRRSRLGGLLPKGRREVWITGARNAARDDGVFRCMISCKLWAIPVESARSPPALFQLSKDLQPVPSRGLNLAQVIDKSIDQFAEEQAQFVVHHEVVHEIIQDPVPQGHKRPHPDDHARLIVSR